MGTTWMRVVVAISIGVVLGLVGCASMQGNSTGKDVRSKSTADPGENTVPGATYISDKGTRMTALFDTQAHTVTVKLPNGRTVTLPRAISGSGARYSNDRETFWEHQGVGSFWTGERLIFQGKVEQSK